MNDSLIKVRLSAMMFLQYLALPVWFIPLMPYVARLDGGANWLFACGLIMGIGTCASPIVCMLADRHFNAERVLAACNVISAITLGATFFTTSPALVFAMLLVSMVAYMPTWSIASAIAMEHVSTIDFPKLRVFGSLGWVASAVFSVIAAKCFNFPNFDASRWIFAAGSAVSAINAIHSLTLPKTSPAANHQPPTANHQPLTANRQPLTTTLSEIFGLKALSLFRNRNFLGFFILFFVSQIFFQWYMAYNSVYLAESGFRYLTLTQNLGQVAEIGSMLIIPWIVRRFGYRLAFASGVAAIALRYALFLVSVKTGSPIGDFGGILIQGFAFGLTIILSQMYIGEIAPSAIRNQAQGLVMLISCGIGTFASNLVFHNLINASAIVGTEPSLHDWTLPFAVATVGALVTAVAILKFFNPGIPPAGKK